MIGLILETSTEKGAIVLSREDRPIAFTPLLGGAFLSKNLALEVDQILKNHSLKPDYLAVGTGPGSYTGIRVGAALARALSFGWKIPLFGFCGLSSFAPLDAPPHAVVVDAKMGGVYVLQQAPPQILSLAVAEVELRDIPLLFSPHPEMVKKRLSLSGEWFETAPDPKTLASIGYSLFLEGKLETLSLVYPPTQTIS